MKSKKKFLLLSFIALHFSLWKAQAQPCLNGWQYRVPVYIDNSAGGVLTAHQFAVSVNSQNLIVQGKMNANGSDIRILSKSGSVLPFWIENTSFNTSSSKIWFKTSVAASSIDTVYLFYGSSGATSLSNGESTFELFDGFSESSINTGTWNACTNGTATLSNGQLHLASGSGEQNTLESIETITASGIAEMYVAAFDKGRGMVGIGNFTGTPTGYATVVDEPFGSIYNIRVNKLGASGPCFTTSDLVPPNNTGTAIGSTTGEWGFTWPSTGTMSYRAPEGEWTISNSAVLQPSTAKLFLGLMEETGGVLSVDWVRARKYAAVPPTISTGTETSVSISLSLSSNSPVCQGNELQLNANGPSGATYAWSGPGGFSATQANAQRNNVQPVHSGTYTITATIPGGCASYSSTVDVVVNPTSSGGNISGAERVCASANNGEIILSGHTGHILRWESSASGQAPWTAISETNDTLSFEDVQASTWYRAVVENTGCAPVNSPSAKITVDAPTVQGTLTGSDEACFGSNSGTLQLLNTTDSIVQWEKSTDGLSWTAIAHQETTFSYSNLTNTTQYRVRLQNGLCPDTVSTLATVTVLPLPVPDFSSDTACLGTVTNFSNQCSIPSGSLAGYTWDFGNGSTSSATNASTIFGSYGNRSVTLTATSAAGCQASITKTAYVAPNPTAAFSVGEACISDSIQVSNASSIPAGAIASYDWDFGDGNQSSLDGPSHLYASPGAYTISLTATSVHGCTGTVAKTVNVHPDPTAAFVRDSITVSEPVQYTNTSTISSGNLGYSWNFGDGGLSSLGNPSHTFGAAGTVQTVMVALSTFGCSDTVRETLVLPSAGFTATTVCHGDTTEFTNASAVGSGSLSYRWNFGDGNTSSLQNPKHIFANAGTYSVTLTVTTDAGHKAVHTANVQVDPNPIANFTVANPCDTVAAVFTNTSGIAAGTLAYSWNLGNGATSALADPEHLFPTSGTYQVKLSAISAKGCVDSVSKPVTVHPRPVADFSYVTVCDGSPAQLTNASTLSAGTMSYAWNFGDGAGSTQENPSHQYLDQGSYQVQLVATSNHGCLSVVEKEIDVYEIPFIATSNNSPLCVGGELEMAAAGPAGATFAWSGPNGFSAVSDTALISAITLSQAGTYTVTATIAGGCSYTATAEVFVDAPTVAGNVSGATRVCISDNEGTVSLSGHTGSVLRWESSLSGLAPWTAINVTSDTLGYEDLQTVTWFRAVVQNGTCAAGNSSSVKVNVDAVSNPGTLLGSNDICFGANSGTLQLVNTTDSILNWEKSTDGGLSWSTVNHQQFTRTYSNLTDTTLFRARLQNGVCADTHSTTAELNVLPLPIPAFSSDTVCLGNATSFTNGSSVAAGAIASYNWDFGNGNTSTAPNASTAFGTHGNHQVTLTAVTADGCTASHTGTAYVAPNPTALFTVSDECVSDSVQTSNQSSIAGGGTLSYNWQFGDGNVSALAEPAHLFASAGMYAVTLTASSSFGCFDETSAVVTAHPDPVAGFLHDTVSESEPLQYINTSSISNGNIGFNWSFGDGNFSTLGNPAHVFGNPGTYETMLLVTSTFGCTDTLRDSVLVVPLPKAGFTATTECLWDTTRFTNTSTVFNDTLLYEWHFGDGGVSHEKNPVHVYNVPGVFNVSLKITTSFGYTDMFSTSVYVNPNPIADFSTSNTCDTVAAVFDNTSTISSGTLSYIWTFEPGKTSTLANPEHLFPGNGTYDVKLLATSSLGCVDSVVNQVTVYSRPEASFTYEKVCDGFPTPFTNTTVLASGTVHASTWDFGDGTNSISMHPTHQYLNKGAYTVRLRVSSEKGCESIIEQPVEVFEVPLANFEFENVCFNEPMVFRNTSRVGAGTLDYRWVFGDSDSSTIAEPVVNYSAAGVYDVSLKIQSENGCVDSITRKAQVYALPGPMVFAEQDSLSKGYTTTLHATGGAFYAWSPTVGLSTPFQPSTMARPFETTRYTVEVIDSNGCTADTSIAIGVTDDYKVIASNVLTPDGNGKNDQWAIRNVDAYTTAHVQVYDRWGALVYDKPNYQNDWTGTNSAGDLLPDGSYYYVVTFEGSDRIYKGAITILRNK